MGHYTPLSSVQSNDVIFYRKVDMNKFEKRKQVCSHCPGTKAMKSGQTYFWRVDAVAKDGSIQPGPVWQFTVK